MTDILRCGGGNFPIQLTVWWVEILLDRMFRPLLFPLLPHRPFNSATLASYLKVQFTISVLDKMGVATGGIDGKGCQIVAQVLKISPDSAYRSLKQRFRTALGARVT